MAKKNNTKNVNTNTNGASAISAVESVNVITTDTATATIATAGATDTTDTTATANATADTTATTDTVGATDSTNGASAIDTADNATLLAQFTAIQAELNARGVKIPNAKKPPVDDNTLIEEIEQVACDLSPVEFGKKVKALSDSGIETLAARAHVRNMWATMANPQIRRMRLIMELKATYYPQECGHLSAGTKTKTNSGFKALPTQQLIDACQKHGLNVKISEDDKVNRMRATMLLNALGINPQDMTATA